MKKVLFAIAIVLMMGFCASAQDGFFNSWDDVSNGVNRDGDDPTLGNISLPGVPGSHGNGGNVTAPLGSGLLVLTALGAGYAVARRKE